MDPHNAKALVSEKADHYWQNVDLYVGCLLYTSGADPTFFGRDGKLRGLKRQCYEGGIRIPFIAPASISGTFGSKPTSFLRVSASGI